MFRTSQSPQLGTGKATATCTHNLKAGMYIYPFNRYHHHEPTTQPIIKPPLSLPTTGVIRLTPPPPLHSRHSITRPPSTNPPLVNTSVYPTLLAPWVPKTQGGSALTAKGPLEPPCQRDRIYHLLLCFSFLFSSFPVFPFSQEVMGEG